MFISYGLSQSIRIGDWWKVALSPKVARPTIIIIVLLVIYFRNADNENLTVNYLLITQVPTTIKRQIIFKLSLFII